MSHFYLPTVWCHLWDQFNKKIPTYVIPKNHTLHTRGKTEILQERDSTYTTLWVWDINNAGHLAHESSWGEVIERLKAQKSTWNLTQYNPDSVMSAFIEMKKYGSARGYIVRMTGLYRAHLNGNSTERLSKTV